MSFNKYMHPNNIYRNPPDFKKLATLYPEFQPYVSYDTAGRAHVDYRNHEALRALTRILLKHDFNLEVEIPPDRLIPTLPSRLNYLLWIEDLLTSIPQNLKTSEICGLDIGTGATCIYPLLATKNKWKFVATDSDAVAATCAQRNVEKNNLQYLIKIVNVPSGSCYLDAMKQDDRRFDFSMCNPPFFVSEEANPHGKGRKSSRPPPKAVNCPTESEAVTDGGEVALIEKMLQESILLKDKIKIYTTMMGKKQSMKYIKKALFKELGKEVSSFVTTEFCQGYTIRWGIAWTCISDIKLDQIATCKRPKEIVGKPIGFEIKYSDKNPDNDLENTMETAMKLLTELKINYTQLKANRQMASLHCTAVENTWSNQRRKRRALIRQAKEGESSSAHILNISDDANITKTETCVNENTNGNCSSSRTAEETVDFCQQNGDASLLSQDSPHLEKSPLVSYLLMLRKVHKHIVLEMQWISGSLGRDGCHQIMQYFKNKLG